MSSAFGGLVGCGTNPSVKVVSSPQQAVNLERLCIAKRQRTASVLTDTIRQHHQGHNLWPHNRFLISARSSSSTITMLKDFFSKLFLLSYSPGPGTRGAAATLNRGA